VSTTQPTGTISTWTHKPMIANKNAFYACLYHWIFITRTLFYSYCNSLR